MGGRVFGALCEQIKQENVQPTINKFIEQFGDVVGKVPEYKTLGSTGKKEVSGDIDLAVSEFFLNNLNLSEMLVAERYVRFKQRARTATEDQLWLRSRLSVLCDILTKGGFVVSDKSINNGVIFFEFPQYNEADEQIGKMVQIDVNFGNLTWLEFTYYSNDIDMNIKGLHRTQLILHILSYLGYTMNHNRGVKVNGDDEWIIAHPEGVRLLIEQSFERDLQMETLTSYHWLIDWMEGLTMYDWRGIMDLYLKTLDSTRCDIPEDLQWYWIGNQERLGLTGKFLPETSNLCKYVTTQQ